MSATSLRCPNCGKRVLSTARTCLSCGAEQPLRVRRVRCGYCSRRVPANASVCPFCNHNPRGFYIRRRHLVGILGLGVLVAIAYAAFNAPVWFNALAVGDKPTPTLPSTDQPVVLVVTATEPVTETTAPTLAPTPADSPTGAPTRAPTTTPTSTRTPTRRAIVFQPPPVPTTTFTSTPNVPTHLLAPADGSIISGSRRGIPLFFQTAGDLAPNEWYRIQVDFYDRNSHLASWCGWTKGGSIVVPGSYYEDSWPFNRRFQWHVDRVTSSSDFPSTCAAPSQTESAQGDVWQFYWY